MLKKAVLVLVVLLMANIAMARNVDSESLNNFVDAIASAITANDLSGFQKLCKADVQINGRPAEKLEWERMFAILKDTQTQYGYKEILRDNRRRQKVSRQTKEFYLGGHKYNHLTLKLDKIEGVWVIVGLDQCL